MNIEVEEEKLIWIVITNSDRTEGRGFPVIKAYCYSETTARRLARGKGVQGSNATIRMAKAFRHGATWYSETRIQPPSREDEVKDTQLMAVRAARQKASAAGLTDEEIKLLQS